MKLDEKAKRINLRRARERSGRRAETLASWFLRLKGYKILQQRFKTQHGEIDIIARKGLTLAIIEVKQRRSLKAAEDSIPAKARKRIERTTQHYIARNKSVQALAIRFDAVFVIKTQTFWPHIIHARDLWRVY